MGKYRLAGRVYGSKAAVEARLRKIRDQGIGLPRVPYHHEQELVEFLEHHHPTGKAKLAAGVKEIRVVPNASGPGHGFELVNQLGNAERFSFRFTTMTSSRKATVARTARMHVRGQIDGWKQHQFSKGDPVCALSGTPLTPHDCEVDHEAPDTFDALLCAWLSDEGLTYDTIPMMPNPNGHGSVFRGFELTKRWQSYHFRHARLRLLATEVHRELSKA